MKSLVSYTTILLLETMCLIWIFRNMSNKYLRWRIEWGPLYISKALWCNSICVGCDESHARVTLVYFVPIMFEAFFILNYLNFFLIEFYT